MAISAPVSVHPAAVESVGSSKEIIADVTLSGTYATGGYSLTPADFGLSEVYFVEAVTKAPGTTALVYLYDHTAFKLQAYGSNGAADAPLAEQANGTANTDVVRVKVRGI